MTQDLMSLDNITKIDNKIDDSDCSENANKRLVTTGEYLKSIRLQKKITENDIFSNLKIKPRIIKAIENNDYANLPDTVTVVALVRQYANFLSLDGGEISNSYKNEISGTEQKIDVIFPDKLPSSFRPFKQSILVTCILLAVYFFLSTLNSTNNILPDIKPIVENDNNNKTGDNIETTKYSDIITQEIIPILHFDIIRKPEIMVQAKGDNSWIEIKDTITKRVIFSGILKDGDTFKIPYELKGLQLKAGNSSPLSIKINDDILDIFPKNSRVLRNFSVDADKLLEIYTRQKSNQANPLNKIEQIN